jgi:phosphatidylglycerol:prolipoprotein diacylglycerol transferase
MNQGSQMYPYLIRLQNISLASYPFLFGLGLTIAGIVMLILGKRDGYTNKQIGNLFILLAFSVLIGGRVLFIIEFYPQFLGKWEKMIELSNGGQIFYGGLILSILMLIVYCKRAKLKISITMDLTIVAVPLGLAIGRLGCFCKGCCYGKPSNFAWALSFPKHIDIEGNIVGCPAYLHQLDDGLISPLHSQTLPVHPTQLYSAAVSLVIFVFMLWLWEKEYAKGKLLFVYLAIYSVFRFLIEFIRENKMITWGLTLSQLISLIIIALLSSYFIVYCYKLDE